MTKTYQLADILTVLTGVILSPRGSGAVYDICNHLTGNDLMTHQLGRASRACGPHIAGQHPDLAGIEVPADWGSDPEAAIGDWIAGLVAVHGPSRDLAPLPAGMWQRRNPIEELVEMTGGRKPVVVCVADDGGAP